jgi:glycerol-3-phosphate acyltransferase PlsY
MFVGLAVLVVVVAYLLGAVPTGVVICRLYGADPRLVGSGRTGGTNVYRTAGLPAALITVVGDIAKGYVAVLFAQILLGRDPWMPLVASLAALASIIGHNYSVFAGFKGGAGSTPNLGALLAIQPLLAIVGLLAGIAILVTSRMASLASLSVSLAVALGLVVLAATGRLMPLYLVYGIGQAVLLSWALRPNIARLRAGTERRIGARDESAP